MEMVGTPAIRERMRGVAEAMSIIHNKPEADPDEGEYHYLRWMVECLADENLVRNRPARLPETNIQSSKKPQAESSAVLTTL
jgi:hypothetical protein